ncbi:MAG: putative DNA-binding domain-containing protein [Rhodoferax sp.]|nr:putative DNA-binding domain-containing protein [Rhodoferax sp.]
MNADLAAQQQALLNALLAWPADDAMKEVAAFAHPPSARGLKAYQANGHALAERAMQAAYPVLTQLLGEESMGALARAFWHAYPPVRGDVAQWGGGLADFVQASEQLADEPYLADVARVEWALHQAACAADAALDGTSFALLTRHDARALQLRLVPGCSLVESPWPVVSIITAHQNAGSTPDLEEAGRRLRAGLAECAVVWRQGLRPQVALCSPAEAAFVRAVLAGASLSSALECAGDLAFNLWLPAAVQSGLVVGVAHMKGFLCPEPS